MVNAIQTQLRHILDENRPADSTRPPSKKWMVVAAVALVAIALAAYGRTLTTYFLADDFGEVAYVSRIADGRWDLFWANWTGNFMQIPGMAVYRPFLLVSLLSDYLLFKANAVGYYATNLLFYVGDVLMLFLVAQKLTSGWGYARSITIAFLSGALFAVSPLHCETVSWVVGRVDSSCLLFSLTSIYCFLRSRENNSWKWLAASVAFFFGGLLFKEMAIGVPVLATAIALLFPRNGAFNLRALAKETAPFWVATAAYFVVRYLALGTLVGGYTGAIGDGQGAQWYLRWLDIHNYGRLFLPFGVSLFPAQSTLSKLLAAAYVSAATLVALKLFKGEIPVRHTLLLGAWLLAAALPIYKLWGIGMDIEGARFCFFLTVPLSLLLPMILLAPKPDRSFNALSVAVIVLLGLVLYKVTLQTNSNWVHAGKEVRAVFNAATELTAEHPGKKIVVLGIPKRRAGAHMIYNGATFRTMVDPPFTKEPLSSRFLTFDPIFYGPDQYINADRFRQTLQRADVVGPYVWDSKANKFELANQARTMSADFVEVDCDISDACTPIKFVVSWDKGYEAERIVTPSGVGSHKFRIPVSHYWRWFSNGTPSKYSVKASLPDTVAIKSARLISAENLRPALTVENIIDDGSGVFAVEPSTRFSANAQAVPNAASLLIECSKPNYFFDQIPEADQASAVLKSFTHKGTAFSGTLPADMLPKKEFCELRVRALDAAGKPIAEYSEPTIVYLR
jgi:hypothetical protein